MSEANQDIGPGEQPPEKPEKLDGGNPDMGQAPDRGASMPRRVPAKPDHDILSAPVTEGNDNNNDSTSVERTTFESSQARFEAFEAILGKPVEFDENGEPTASYLEELTQRFATDSEARKSFAALNDEAARFINEVLPDEALEELSAPTDANKVDEEPPDSDEPDKIELTKDEILAAPTDENARIKVEDELRKIGDELERAHSKKNTKRAKRLYNLYITTCFAIFILTGLTFLTASAFKAGTGTKR